MNRSGRGWDGLRAWLPLLVGGAVLALLPAVRGQPPGDTDPVAPLRQALRALHADLQARDQAIGVAAERVQTLSDLHRSLALRDWRDGHPDPRLAAIDGRHRSALAGRYLTAARAELARSEPVRVLAALDELVEATAAARVGAGVRGLTGRLAPEVAARTARGPLAVRAAAARALGRIEPDPAVAAGALAPLLHGAEADLHLPAAEGLAGLLEVATQPATESADAEPEGAVLVALHVLPAVRRGLSDPQAGVRRCCLRTTGLAAATLADLTARRAPPALLRPLALALGEQAPGLAQAVRGLEVRGQQLALDALLEMTRAGRGGAAAEPAPLDGLREGLRLAVPALAAVMASAADAQVRRTAAEVLEGVGPPAASAAPALTRALDDPDRFVRWSAARALGSLGPDAAPVALPGLARRLADPDPDVRQAACTALARVAPREADGSVRVVATTTTGPRHTAQAYLPTLVEALQSDDPALRLAVLHALRHLDVDPRPALPALCRSLADTEESVRQAAAEVLGALGPAARSATPELRRALADPSPGVRRAAGEALLALGGPALPG